MDVVRHRLAVGEYADNPARFASDMRAIRLHAKAAGVDAALAASIIAFSEEFEVCFLGPPVLPVYISCFHACTSAARLVCVFGAGV